MILVLAFLWGTGSDGELSSEGFIRGGTLAVLLFGSVFLHELGHAIAARAFHRKVSEVVITLWGGHTTFDSKDISPMVSGVTALAGPLVNGVIALGGWAALGLDLSSNVHRIVAWLVYSNTALGVFNALPGIPMDGGRVLEAMVWKATGRRTTGIKVAAWAGRVIAIGFLCSVLLANLGNTDSLNVGGLLWGVLIFSLLWPAASLALKSATMMERIENIPVEKVMRTAVGVAYDLSLIDAQTIAEQEGVKEVVVLAADGAPSGHFSVASANEVPPPMRASTSLSALTIPLPRGTEVSPGLTGMELLSHAREWWGKTDALIVTDDGDVVGIVYLAEVSERLS
jgi:Zn-dependent protease